MADKPRIGVYVCHCGLNIAGVVNVKEVVRDASSLEDVAVARDYIFMCSDPGQEMIKKDIAEKGVNRVVVAACSPSMHETTFRGVLREAGLNPYLLEIANIRECCSWVHDDKHAATEKAKELVRMSVAKARLLEPLEDIVVDVKPSVLVLGGGVSGLTAALNTANRGFNVYLVEKSPTLGGNAARVGYLVGSERRGVEAVKKLVEAVRLNPRIHVFTNSELESLDGAVGNFTALIRVDPRYVTGDCTLCGKCADVCPVQVENEYEYGLNKRKAIYLPFKGAYPEAYVIDGEACTRCGKCVEVCDAKAIDLDQEGSRVEVEVGAVIIATGYSPYEPVPGEYGYGESSKIITLFQLERILDTDGPTGGELKIGGETPGKIAFIMCVGSMGTTENASDYCSRMCCSSALRNILRIKEKYPNTDIYVFFWNMVTYERGGEDLYLKASEHGVKFVRVEDPPKVSIGGGVSVEAYDVTVQEEIRVPVDLLVLVNGMTPPRDLKRVCTVTKASLGPDGFLREAHLKLRPVESPTDGIFLAGAVTGPKNIVESMTAGGAAASKAASLLATGKVTVEPTIAVVSEDVCSGCGTCVQVCSFNAVELVVKDGRRVSHVESLMCKGCGACVAACPSGAMQQQKYTDEQVLAEVDVLEEDGFKPLILSFLCRWCASAAADLAGTMRIKYPPSILPLRVNCSGRVDPSYIVRALLDGVDGVLVGACHPGDCHYIEGNLKARRRMAVVKNTLKTLGLEPERVRFEYISASEGLKFAKVAKDFTEQIRKLGPNPLRGGGG